ncbi:MAG: MgtC/SapB family protein [Planctomycetota bacterium]
MFDQPWAWAGDIHQLVAPHWAGVIVTVMSILCGGLIGIERERAQKPAGMRTLILICLGSAIFTQASILIVGDTFADRGRIAAQVVTGVGFLGAGAIIRERGLLVGITTGAGIWATAAVGVVLGTGHVVAGVFVALLIVGTLAAARLIDAIISGPCEHVTLHLTFNPVGGKTILRIEAILTEHQHTGELSPSEAPDGRQTVSIRYCRRHREHRKFLLPLLALDDVDRVVKG